MQPSSLHSAVALHIHNWALFFWPRAQWWINSATEGPLPLPSRYCKVPYSAENVKKKYIQYESNVKQQSCKMSCSERRMLAF